LTWIDLGSAPPSNSYLSRDALAKPEVWLPLRVLVCERCWLVQTEDFSQSDRLFDGNYAYFSSVSQSWLRHSKDYVDRMASELRLGDSSFVVEVAANDGYLLQYVQARGVPCLGIEPTASTASAARSKGLEIVENFFGVKLAQELAANGRQADLMVANNVLAHVPDVNDFVRGFAILLKDAGVATFEFPHLLRLVEGVQFDTVYHEHFSYLSLVAVDAIFARNGLQVFDVQEIPTHGGSLRVFAQRSGAEHRRKSAAVTRLLDREIRAGMTTRAYYSDFQRRCEAVKNGFLEFLLQARRQGNGVAAYGAAAKGNTLLNFAGIRPDLLPYVVDKSTAKQGKFLPGSRIPVVDEAWLRDDRPAYVILLPWNLKVELAAQLDYVREWGGRLVTAVPAVTVLS
jgi:SAM-dependent methyltransferase